MEVGSQKNITTKNMWRVLPYMLISVILVIGAIVSAVYGFFYEAELRRKYIYLLAAISMGSGSVLTCVLVRGRLRQDT